ncbi:MAG: RNA polymerase sigma factor [Candidatus Aminicenantia bacterium]
MKLDDKELVAQTLKGREEAFEMIIKRYQTPIINFIGRMVGEYQQAVDLSQEVFIKAYSSLSLFDPKYKFSNWLFKIASNLCIDFWRKKKIFTFSMDQSISSENNLYPQISDAKPSVIEQYEKKQLIQKLEKVIDKLPPSLRELFVLRHINDLSYQEIAQIKEIPVGTVKNKVFRAKERIKFLLEEEK